MQAKVNVGHTAAFAGAHLILADLPFERATRFEDLETTDEVMAVPGLVRAHYLEAIGGLIDRYRRELGAAGMDYTLLPTSQPLELALLSYLSTRSKAL